MHEYGCDCISLGSDEALSAGIGKGMPRTSIGAGTCPTSFPLLKTAEADQ